MDIEKVRSFFKDDTFAQLLGIQIDSVEPGKAVCSLKINKNHLNADNVAQGGVIFTLADLAFAVAANADGKWTVSLNNNISYMKPAKGNVLYAHAQKISGARKICVYEVLVTDEKNTPLAHMTVNGYIKDLELDFT